MIARDCKGRLLGCFGRLARTSNRVALRPVVLNAFRSQEQSATGQGTSQLLLQIKIRSILETCWRYLSNYIALAIAAATPTRNRSLLCLQTRVLEDRFHCQDRWLSLKLLDYTGVRIFYLVSR